MARKRHPLTKTELVCRLVPGLRPKLDREQLRDLSLVHHVNLDALRNGSADAELMWQWLGGTLTWLRVAESLQLGLDDMRDQAALCLRVADRYRATGQVTLTEDEYELAVAGVIVMDELARRVDRATAVRAADWSEEQISRIAAAAVNGDSYATA
jgi:hypothetical protein